MISYKMYCFLSSYFPSLMAFFFHTVQSWDSIILAEIHSLEHITLLMSVFFVQIDIAIVISTNQSATNERQQS